jgi:hypothetical protein
MADDEPVTDPLHRRMRRLARPVVGLVAALALSPLTPVAPDGVMGATISGVLGAMSYFMALAMIGARPEVDVAEDVISGEFLDEVHDPRHAA